MKVGTVRALAAGFRWRCALCPAAGKSPDQAAAEAASKDHYDRCHREDA